LQGEVKCGSARTDTAPVLYITIVLTMLIVLWGGLIPLHRRHSDSD
jgi:hypothetical protein